MEKTAAKFIAEIFGLKILGLIIYFSTKNIRLLLYKYQKNENNDTHSLATKNGAIIQKQIKHVFKLNLALFNL